MIPLKRAGKGRKLEATRPQRNRQQKAERIRPEAELSPDELSALTGDDAPLVESGHVQYWRINQTVGEFTASTPGNVWNVRLHIVDEFPTGDVLAILVAFWDSQKPEYITTQADKIWALNWLEREVGFGQIGLLPLSNGPVSLLGWRKCH